MSKKVIIMVTALLLILSSGLMARDLSLPYDEDEVPQEFNQAPELDEVVEEGEIPPVDERVPDDPYMVEPRENIGEYGGTLNAATLGIDSFGDDTMVMDVINSFARPSAEGDELVLNFAKDIEVSDDSTTYTFYLREGVRWSDGEPFTTEDIEFWYEDMLLNEDYTPVISDHFKDAEGEVMDLSIIDDHTFEIEFGTPNPYFLEYMVHEVGWAFLFPKHFFKEYHPDYISEAEMEEKLEEHDYDNWYDLFGYMATTAGGQARMIEGVPTLGPYKLVRKSSDRRVWERNPYYWKVDSEGNQLPYIDEIDTHLVSDMEVLNGEIMSGEIDYAAYNTDIRNYPMFREYEDEGNYNVHQWTSGFASDVIYMFNLTHEDEDLREVFQEKKFRQAMSLGIDREEINESIYYGRAEPVQFTVMETSKFYKEEYKNAYTEYDPERAKELLDEIGLEDRDDDGWRELPDGSDFNFTLEYVNAETPKLPNIELVQQHWQELGIDVSTREISGELSSQRVPGNMVEANVWHGDETTDIMFPHRADKFVPHPPDWALTHFIGWGRWFETDGEEGQEPPENVKELYGWHEQVIVEPDEERREELADNILSSQAENLWSIGTVGGAPWIAAVNENLKNIPDDVVWVWDTLWTSTRDPEQFYFEGGQRAE
ncbi:MAG: ABC transporter substrate-binding protein [Halanaerobiales bacterium]